MLVARQQWEVARHFVADFSRRSNVMQKVSQLQAQHVAVVASLRAIGNILQAVDGDTPEKKRWLKDDFETWRHESIFVTFIKGDRDKLLKEFRGFLEVRNPAFGLVISVADPASPTWTSYQVDFDPDALLTHDGRPALDLYREALAFWDQTLLRTERAFAGLPSAG